MRVGRMLTLTISFSLFTSLALGVDPTVFMVPSKVLIVPEEEIDVEIWLNGADDLGAWQVTFEVTGGDAGSLDFVDHFIDTARTDYVFFGLNSMEAVSEPTKEMAGVMMDLNCPDVTEPAYLGTYQYRASPDAMGVFNIRFVDDDVFTFLTDCEGVLIIPLFLDQDTFIEVECAIDAHCDDGEVCTDDTCDNGTCVFTNDDTNTCTDANECTDDACSSGTCVSTNDDTNTCTDGNECTDDSCSSGICVSTNDDTNTCTDGNDCTSSDACVSGVCTSTDEPIGTPCDDGLFCTATDECDGSGTCVGSGSPCGGRAPYCCEVLSICGMFPCI